MTTGKGTTRNIELAATVRTRKREAPSTPILDRNLVAVLVAVGYPFLCDSMQLGARFHRPLSIHCRRLIRDYATPCKMAKNGLKIRRGQPRGGSTPPPGTNKINGLPNKRIFGCVFLCPKCCCLVQLFLSVWLFSPSCTCDVRLVRALSFLTVAAHSAAD
jgi:hypothetical protein